MQARIVVLVALALSGCAESAMASVDAGPAAPPADAFPAELPVLAADYARCAAAMAPVAHDRGSITLVAHDLVTAVLSDGTTIRYFDDDALHEADCIAPSCVEVVTDALGAAPVTSQLGGWSAYRVNQRLGPTYATTIADTLAYNVRAPDRPGDVLHIVTLSKEYYVRRLWPDIHGGPPPGTGVLLARVVDCDGLAVARAVTFAFKGDTFLPDGHSSRDIRYLYPSGDFGFAYEEPWTTASGTVAIISIPIDAAPVRVEAWARTDAGLTRLGCEAVRLIADGVTTVDIGPLRIDYPPGHPCAR